MSVTKKDKIYDLEKLRRVCNTTLSNYINMEKRLNANKRFSNFILTYYSIFLIISSLTSSFFDLYNSKLGEYFGVIISVVLLAFSLINSNANYDKRIDVVTIAINKLKTLKRNTALEAEEFKKEYDEIVDNVEFRSDIDFFRTVKSYCKKSEINWYFSISDIQKNDEQSKQLKEYLSEISRFWLQFEIISTIIFRSAVVVFPLIIMLLCFLVKQ